MVSLDQLVDQETQTVIREAFLKDAGGRRALAVLLKVLGTWSSEPVRGSGQAALRAFGMKLLDLLGINHELREQEIVDKLASILPVRPGEVEELTQGESDGS